MMKKIEVLSLLAIVAMGLSALAAPRISVDFPIYDFGKVLEGAFVSHTFTLTNNGAETLTITRVRTTCGCTTTALSTSKLAPGESVRLEVQFNSSGYSGPVTKTIYVLSNAPETPTLSLQVTGTVIRAKPYQIAVADLADMLYLLIDLRKPEDYATGHLMGAMNIPYAEIDLWKDRLPHDVLIILYDQDSTLSDQAAQTLNEGGFPDAKSLIGGFDEWTAVYQERFLLTPAEG